MMRRKQGFKVRSGLFFFFTTGFLVLIFCGSSLSQSEFMIYPNKGQSQQQLEKDKYECYQWAKQQSGFDPMAPPTTSTAPPPSEAPVGGVGKGAVGGGLLGLAVGAIAGDAGKGAAIGAVSGGVIGGVRRSGQKSREEQAQQQWASQEANRYSQGRSQYNRAFSACMDGRNYTVK